MTRDDARRRVLTSLGLTEADLAAEDHGYEAARAAADRERAATWEQIKQRADRIAADLNAEWRQAAGTAFERIAVDYGAGPARPYRARCTADDPCPAFNPVHLALYGGCYFHQPEKKPPNP